VQCKMRYAVIFSTLLSSQLFETHCLSLVAVTWKFKQSSNSKQDYMKFNYTSIVKKYIMGQVHHQSTLSQIITCTSFTQAPFLRASLSWELPFCAFPFLGAPIFQVLLLFGPIKATTTCIRLIYFTFMHLT
jgi:hypothetical protein